MTSRPAAHRPHQPLALRAPLPTPLAVTLLVACSAVAVVTSVIAREGAVPSWELEVLRTVNGWPDWLQPPLWVVQQLGVVVAPVVAGIVVAWLVADWRHLVPFALVPPLKLTIEKAVVKQLVDRERPMASTDIDIDIRGPAVEGLSFPSGHATTAFALAVLLVAYLPGRWRPVPLCLAAVVAISRVYHGEHNLLDVVAGAAIGTAFGTILWLGLLNGWLRDPVGDPRTRH